MPVASVPDTILPMEIWYRYTQNEKSPQATKKGCREGCLPPLSLVCIATCWDRTIVRNIPCPSFPDNLDISSNVNSGGRHFELGMYLENSRFDFGIGDEVPESLTVPVAHSDIPDQPLLHCQGGERISKLLR